MVKNVGIWGLRVNHDHLTTPSYWFFKAFVAVLHHDAALDIAQQ